MQWLCREVDQTLTGTRTGNHSIGKLQIIVEGACFPKDLLSYCPRFSGRLRRDRYKANVFPRQKTLLRQYSLRSSTFKSVPNGPVIRLGTFSNTIRLRIRQDCQDHYICVLSSSRRLRASSRKNLIASEQNIITANREHRTAIDFTMTPVCFR